MDLFGRFLKHLLERQSFFGGSLRSDLGSLGGALSILHSRTELLDTTLSVNEGLSTSVEGVAGTAHNHVKDWFDRTSYKLVATGTSDFNF